MGIRRGSISTPIIADGLLFNMDAANRASYVPDATLSYNTTNLSISGSLINDTSFIDSDPKSWDFDGVDDYITMGDVNELDFSNTDTYTLSAWIKATESGNEKVFTKALFGGDYTGWAMYINGIKLNASLVESLSSYIHKVGTTNLTLGVWFNITTTYDGSSSASGMNLYVNGSLESMTTSRDDLAGSSVTTAPLNIGSMNDGSSDFAGNIANAQIYNRALSASEVLHNYNALKGRYGL